MALLRVLDSHCQRVCKEATFLLWPPESQDLHLKSVCSHRMVLYTMNCTSPSLAMGHGVCLSVSPQSLNGTPDHSQKSAVQTLLVPPLPPSDQIVYPTSLTLANAYPATATQAVPTPTSTTAAYNETVIGDVDIAQVFVNNPSSDSYTLFGFWVNGTELAAYTTKNIGLSTQPQSPFPYSRLAGTTGGNSSNVYLYHQINGTFLAEDMYNLDGGFFTTTYFNISTS